MENKNRDMEAMRAYKFRTCPDTKRQEAIDDAIPMSQRPYNKFLEKTIGAHKSNPPSKISQRTINQGMQMDSDINASISVLHKATTLGQTGSHTQRGSVRPQIGAVLAELRTYPANAGGANGL